MKKICPFLLALALFVNVKGQTWFVVPDTAFVKYLQYIVPTAMHGDSLNTSSTLVTTSTQTMSIGSRHITNLNGIQYFSSLTSLTLAALYLTNLFALPNSITNLSCTANYCPLIISALPSSLTNLTCEFDSLDNLPALPSSLKTINCSYNFLTSLPALPSSIQQITCNNNNLTSLPTLPNSIQLLICYSNSLTSLPALPNYLFFYISCSKNNLTSLPTLPDSLNTLYCDFNSITSLPILNTRLTYLDCHHNSLTSLPVLPNLNYLDCTYNQITCFPIFPNTFCTITYDSFGTPHCCLLIDGNPYNCLPNYLPPSKMLPYDLSKPLCATGNSNGCPAATGIETFNTQNLIFSIYPNPTTSVLNVELGIQNGAMEVDVINTLGEMVYTTEIMNQKSQIDVSALPAGVYFVRVDTATQKFIKQ